MHSFYRFRLSSALLVALSLAVGCNGAKGPTDKGQAEHAAAHDPHDVPITEADVKMPANYAEAIPRIKEYRDAIRSAVEAGTPSKAHRPLDELDIVLNKLPTLARDSGIAKEHWETINVAARELRDLFNQVHSAIDEKRPPDYAAVSDDIEKTMERLAALAPAENK